MTSTVDLDGNAGDLRSIGIAVIGAGAFSELHLNGYAELAGAHVAGVVDVDPSRAARAARLAGGVAWATDLQSLSSLPEVDGVDICTPNVTHAAIALQALRAGKHVLVEKPPALSLGEFDEMVEAATEHGVTVGVGLVLRYAPWVRALREGMAAGAVGRPEFVRLQILSGMVWPGGAAAWQRDRAVSGGHIVHNGLHLIDLAGWFFEGDEPVEVVTRGFGAADAVDDHWSMLIRYASGATAVVEYSYCLPDPAALVFEASATGTAGSMSVSSLDAATVHGPHGDRARHDFRGSSMHHELAEFVESVRTGVLHGVDLATVRTDLAVALAGRESLDRGTPVLLAGADRG